MGDKKHAPVEKWVDLSGLPKYAYGSTEYISWNKCAGYKVPFMYDNIYGYINIVDVDTNNIYGKKVCITIDKYLPTPKWVYSYAILYCMISDYVGNKIIDVAPHLVQYLCNPQDAYAYSVGSSQYIKVRCPYCGCTKKMIVQNLMKSGFMCTVCGDGVSYPNKFIHNMLTQTGIEFKREISGCHKGFEWAQKYLYDFYFNINGEKIILEADGGFHDLPKQQQVDKTKSKLAIQNGFRLIRVDCKYDGHNRREYIKNNILNSELSRLLDLTKIDWKQCDSAAIGSLIRDACNLWNDGMAIKDISKIVQVSTTAINRYLKIGKELGLCESYNAREARSRGGHTKETHGVLCYNDDGAIDVFATCEELVNVSLERFGVQFCISTVYSVCNGSKKTYYGIKMKYISKKEYEDYRRIIKPNQVFHNLICMKNNRCPILVTDEDGSTYIFENSRQFIAESLDLFGQQYSRQYVCDVLGGRKKSCYGKTCRKITQEEYEQYKMIESQNEAKLKEVG